MKNFLIKILNVIMYASFTLTALSIILFPFLEIKGSEYNFYYESPIKFWETLENLVNFILEDLGIHFNVTQMQLFITVFSVSLIFGFGSKGILKKMEESQYK